MRLAERGLALALGLVCTMLPMAGCASNPETPSGWLADRDEVGEDAYGGWVVGFGRAVGRYGGELIAVEPDTIHVLTDRGMVSLERSVTRGTLVKYDPGSGRLVLWSAIGAAATLSHGYFLLFTAPAWALVGTLSVRAENEASRIEIPPGTWDDARLHARFPQGLPAGVVRATLRPKPVGRRP